jgi:hypothetical protein
MNFLRLLPVIVSFLLLSAHFFRSGELFFAVLPIVLIIPLMFRQTWVPRLIQLALILGAVEWLYTLVSVAQIRVQFGMPWARMAIILGAVALFTALSGLMFRSKALRERYSINESP